MNRDAKTQSALIALARTRRMQRALAHSHVFRDAPMPTLRSSLGFMVATTCVVDERSEETRGGDPTGFEGGAGGASRGIDDAPLLGHRMRLLGVARAEAVAYVIEELGETEPPIAYRMWLRGPRRGHLVPIHAWYGDAADEVRARIAAIEPTLEPAMLSTTEAWMLSTRIVQRRALRVAGPGACSDLPIRKFALQLIVEPVSGHGPSGKTTVTAFLRPHARLAEVWSLPTGGAVARVTFTGVPSGLGLAKDTVVLLTSLGDEFCDPVV